jgi:hypothetical protein
MSNNSYAGPPVDPSSMPLGDAALWYAHIEWSVFPAAGKQPLTDHGFKDASNDPDQILVWWTDWPNANVAIAAETSRLVILDVDPKNGGDESLRALIEELKIGRLLEETPKVRTGGGGLHYYFRAPDGDSVRCSAGKLGPGLDIRAAGGYVIAPPSVHPDTGQKYRWEW